MRISDRLPAFLARRLSGRETLRRSVDNSFWLSADQIVRMGAGLFVGVWMARYLGPEQYGWLSYATAVVGTVSAFTSTGLNAVIVRELARSPDKTDTWMGAAFFLKALGGGVGFLVCVGIAWLRPMPLAPTRPLIIIVALGLLFQTLDVFDLFFQATGASRISALVRIAGCVVANLLKVALILLHASLLTLAAVTTSEILICAVGWWWTASRHGQSLARFRLDRSHVWMLLRENWPLSVSGLAIYAQAYADQLIIGAKLGGGELGQYSAAMRIVSIFAFVPTVVHTVAAPEIARAKRDDERLYRRRLYNLYRLMFGLFLVTALPLILLGPPAALLLYGAPYAGTAALLPWVGFRLFFTNLGVARSVFITNEGLFRFALFTAVVGGALNIALNLLLVPRWGARGAIASSFASFGVTTFALEVFQPKARANLRLMARAVCLPWRRYAE